jgi:hypothetical protein
MTKIDLGNSGAKRATWDENPRKLLKSIIDDNPNAGEAEWWKLFKATAAYDQVEAILNWWLHNNVRSLTQRSERTPPQAAAAAAQLGGKLDDRVHDEAEKIVLLVLGMPNGKPLSECTGADCKRFGGWFGRLVEVVPENERVGDVLSEGRLQEIWTQEKNERVGDVLSESHLQGIWTQSQ